MNRRTLLTVVGAGALGLAGCLDGSDPGGDGTPTPTDTPTPPPTDTPTPTPAAPENCPTSQDLDVEWPDELDAASVEAFVRAYERVYFREVVVDYEPESDADSYELSGQVRETTELGAGWGVSYSGSGGVYHPTLTLTAVTGTAPDGADVVPANEVEDDLLSDLLAEAVEEGEADHWFEQPGETINRYNDLLSSLSPDFEPLTGPGESDSLYVDVDGTTVEVTASTDSFHGDYWWDARYYVDERVVRRATEEGVAPREGELLECRAE